MLANGFNFLSGARLSNTMLLNWLSFKPLEMTRDIREKGPCLTFNPNRYFQAENSSEFNKYTIKTLQAHIHLLFNFVTFLLFR